MDLEEYRLMYAAESEHWWFRGLRELVLFNIANNIKPKRNIFILDAGCGTGYLMKNLEQFGIPYGLDISEEALKFCKIRKIDKIAKASINRIPYKTESFDLVVSNDVLCHSLVGDDEVALSEINRVLKKGGLFITNLPAYDSLRRVHDVKVHTKHRYTKNTLSKKLKNANFKVIKITYRHPFLFFTVLLLNILNKLFIKPNSGDVKPVPRVINVIFIGLVRLENLLLRFVDFPIGTSVFCLSKKD